MIVQCSWKVSDGRPIADAVSFAENENSDIEDIVMAENCLMLEAPDKADGAYPTVPACQLLLSCQMPKQIANISVLSEARVMEIYGHHGEYLKTIRNELIEEAEDMVVFKGDIVLDKPLTLCSIKFAGLRSPSEMWLYLVKVNLVTTDMPPQNQMTIPLEAVEQRLAEMELVLSDKAEAFKQLVERCQMSPLFAQQDINYIIANLHLSNLIKNKSPSPQKEFLDSANISSKQIGNILRDNQNNITQNLIKNNINNNEMLKPPELEVQDKSTSPVNFESQSSYTQTDEEYVNLEETLKAYISNKIDDLDKKIYDKLNKRFQEAEAKIICKLEEIEAFVKPQGIETS